MADSAAALPESIECPLCLGKGELSRTEVLERLGMRDFARVSQLSAEEAIRLILKKEKDAEQSRWAKFDGELARRLAEVADKHSAELQKLRSEKGELAARLKGLEESASATLDNARQGERLATEKESQKQLATLTRQIAELEAAQRLAGEQKKAEVAKARAELEGALSGEKAKANDPTAGFGMKSHGSRPFVVHVWPEGSLFLRKLDSSRHLASGRLTPNQ